MPTATPPDRPATPARVGRRPLLVAAASAVVLSGAGCTADRTTRSGSARGDGPEGGRAPVVLEVDGATLRPLVELADDSTAQVSWVDLDTGAVLGTGPAPTLATAAVRRVGMSVTVHDTPAFDHVTTLNVGFHRDDDYGRESLPPSYEHVPQPVTGVAGLRALTGLVRFCAARTPLSGRLELGGLTRLEHVECYGAEVASVDLEGCASLVRLCVEDCRLSELDLGPVRTTLRDLRAAIQRSDQLTFTSLDGPMEALHHYCVRDQPVRQGIPHAQLPVVEEYWAWTTQQRSCDAPTSAVLRSYLAHDNALDQSSVDAVLTGLAGAVHGAGRVDIGGRAPDGAASASPSSVGLASAGDLEARGWRVTVN